MKQFWAFVEKEFFHIFRDVRSVFILLVMPVVQIVLFGFALSTEVKSIKVGVYLPDQDPVAVRIVEAMKVNEYVDVRSVFADDLDFDAMLRSGTFESVVVFGNRFGEKYLADKTLDLNIISDAMDPNTSTTATSYLMAIIGDQLGAVAKENMPFMFNAPADFGPETSVKFLYNPGMKGAYNFVPGVMGLILMLLCAMMASISIVRERELGTMEVLLVSPMKPLYIILAKTVPYFLLSCTNMITVLLLARFVLSVPIKGSLLLLSNISFLFILVSLSLGLLISTISNSQKAAVLLSGMVLMMPTIVLSGMIFPIENMPLALRLVSDIFPAKWYILAVKKVMIEGLSFAYVWKEITILLVMFGILITVSVKNFKSRLC